jgi:hypothetical protein
MRTDEIGATRLRLDAAGESEFPSDIRTTSAARHNVEVAGRADVSLMELECIYGAELTCAHGA